MMLRKNSNLILMVEKDRKMYVVEGMLSAKFKVGNEYYTTHNEENANWHVINNSQSISSVSVECYGRYSNSIAEQYLTACSLDDRVQFFELSLDDGYLISGNFFIQYFERSENVKEEETYHFLLKSSGKITLRRHEK